MSIPPELIQNAGTGFDLTEHGLDPAAEKKGSMS